VSPVFSVVVTWYKVVAPVAPELKLRVRWSREYSLQVRIVRRVNLITTWRERTYITEERNKYTSYLSLKNKKHTHTKTHLPVNYGGRNAYKSIFIYWVKFRKSACPTTETHISKSLSTCLLCDKLPVKAVKTQSIIFETFSSYSI